MLNYCGAVFNTDYRRLRKQQVLFIRTVVLYYLWKYEIHNNLNSQLIITVNRKLDNNNRNYVSAITHVISMESCCSYFM